MTRVLTQLDVATALERQKAQVLADGTMEKGRAGNELRFPLSDAFIDATGRVSFACPRAEAKAVEAFSRWGLRLADYTTTWERFAGAWTATCYRGACKLRRLADTSSQSLKVSGAEHAYLAAVQAGDKELATRLFPASETAELLEQEVFLSRLDAESPDEVPCGRQDSALHTIPAPLPHAGERHSGSVLSDLFALAARCATDRGLARRLFNRQSVMQNTKI